MSGDAKTKRVHSVPAEVAAMIDAKTRKQTPPTSSIGVSGEVIANEQAGSMGSPSADTLTLSATLTDNTTTNVEVTTAAEVSKVHVEYDVEHGAYREAGAFDVVVISTNAHVVNKRRDDVGTGQLVLNAISADVSSGTLRLNLTVGSVGADADFQATLALIDAH